MEYIRKVWKRFITPLYQQSSKIDWKICVCKCLHLPICPFAPPPLHVWSKSLCPERLGLQFKPSENMNTASMWNEIKSCKHCLRPKKFGLTVLPVHRFGFASRLGEMLRSQHHMQSWKFVKTSRKIGEKKTGFRLRLLAGAPASNTLKFGNFENF